VDRCGSKWVGVEYATSIYINTSINIINKQMKLDKINEILNQINLKLLEIKLKNNFNSKNISNNCEMKTAIENKSNIERNKFGFPNIFGK
jgi:hypothetical protein